MPGLVFAACDEMLHGESTEIAVRVALRTIIYSKPDSNSKPDACNLFCMFAITGCSLASNSNRTRKAPGRSADLFQALDSRVKNETALVRLKDVI
jgi:hypothetical protein